jgi:protein disulfide-isomerase-like protein
MRLVLLALAAGRVLGGEAPGEWSTGDAVVHLGDADWDGYREKNPKMLAMFYAPWCGHCKNLKPAYGAASGDTQFQMPMVAVDCTEEKSTCDKFNVGGYPTLKYFSSSTDEGSDYEGGRSKGDLVKFIEENAEPEDLTDTDFSKMRVKKLKKLLQERGEECLGCTDKSEFVAKVKAVINQPKTGPKEKKKKKTKSTLINGRTFMQQRRFDEAKKIADEGWEENGEVVHLIEDKESWDKARVDNKKMLVMFYAPWCGHCKKFKPEFVAASKELAGDEITLAAVECESNKQLCTKFGATSYPTIKYYDDTTGKGKGESFRGARDAEGVITYARRKLAGETNAYGPYKNVPAWDDNGNVFHVGDLHWKEFKEAHPNMLVMFYAPWCGHCKSYKPAFAEASSVLEDRQDEAVLVAVDCTAEVDTCQKYGVNGYPEIMWFKGKAKPIDFDVARTADATVKYIEDRIGGESDDATTKDEL